MRWKPPNHFDVWQTLSTFSHGTTNKVIEEDLLFTQKFEDFIKEANGEKINRFIMAFEYKTTYKKSKLLELIKLMQDENTSS
jgi:hypothetical protein